jgi:hypothetical protein
MRERIFIKDVAKEMAKSVKGDKGDMGSDALAHNADRTKWGWGVAKPIRAVTARLLGVFH